LYKRQPHSDEQFNVIAIEEAGGPQKLNPNYMKGRLGPGQLVGRPYGPFK